MTNGSLACEGKGFQEGCTGAKAGKWERGAREAVVAGVSAYKDHGSDLRDGHSLEVAVQCREGLHGPCVT